MAIQLFTNKCTCIKQNSHFDNSFVLFYRLANKDKLEYLLSNKHVERIEIAMKETIGAKG